MQHRIEQAKQQEQSFIEAKSRFFDIRISSKDICIHVLSSIEEYLQEGKEMHHCVFTNEYFSKADSLILSATDRENNRLATIELSLETFKILQCRAAFNEIPPKKAEIDQLLMSNIGLFKRASA